MNHGYVFWIGFHLLILGLLWADLGIFHRKKEVLPFKKSLFLSMGWISVALLFNGAIYFFLGKESALQFFTGYLVEKSLSVDNLFVFLWIFTHFKVPSIHQHKVLLLGILGALIMRIILILGGIVLLRDFHWISYVLGGFLCFTGIKLFFAQEKKEWHPERNVFIKCARAFFPLSQREDTGRFFIKEGGRWKMTSLCVVLIMIEGSDLIFALDSIPAIFAISKDPFIVYTSNVFAVLGLRELYFVLKHSLHKLYYFKFGLGLILLFIGLKMVLESVFPISLGVSLSVVLLILASTFSLGVLRKSKF